MSVVDLVPTIATLTNTKIPAGYISDGADESTVLLGKRQKVNKDLYWYYNNNPVPGKEENISPMLTIRSGKWKLLMEPDGTRKQLYDLETDHRETTNISDREKAVTTELTAKLTGWYNTFIK